MIFLFGNKNISTCPLAQGANFMETKNSKLHPGHDDFYLTGQAGPLHTCRGGLDANYQLNNMDCTLVDGEAAIIIGHYKGDGKLRDTYDRDVTGAALRLMAKIAGDNPNRPYTFFLAACGGAVQQPGHDSFLSTLVQKTAALAAQFEQGIITCWGYTAEAGLVGLNGGLPPNRKGTHIYGSLEDVNGDLHHCGYDSSVTTRLKRENGRYETISASQMFYPLQEVINWEVKDNCAPDMHIRFQNLYATVKQTSR